MVSSSDTAKQIQFSSLKQDAAEAAFKARHSFGSSDAFRQIFDGIEKSAKAVEPSKDSAPEPVKPDVNGKVHKHKHHHAHSAKQDDKSARHSDCDKHEGCDVKDKQDDVEGNAAAEDAEKASSEKYTYIKKARSKTPASDCSDENCEDEFAEAVESSTGACNTKKTASLDTAEASDVPVVEEADEELPVIAANADSTNQAELQETNVVLEQGDIIGETTTTDDASKMALVNAPAGILPLLVATLQAGLKTDANKNGDTGTKSAPPSIGELKKAAIAPQEPALEKTAAAPNDQDANDAFSAALETETKPAQDTRVETAQENVRSERAATKAANEKHADHIDLLQGKFSAQGTHPAAGDRAISVALEASDSPAPTPNGSAGGGPPIASKGASAVTGTTGLEALHGIEGDNVTFAGTVRGAKEAQASLMAPHEQVAVQLNRMVKSGISQYDLQLHPADLGRIDIRLEIKKDGAVQATVTADNQQTFDMLQKDSRSLERALQQAGLQTDSGSLSFNLRGDGQSQAQQHAQNNNGHPWNKWMEKTLPEEAVQSKVLSFDVASGNGRIDLRI